MRLCLIKGGGLPKLFEAYYVCDVFMIFECSQLHFLIYPHFSLTSCVKQFSCESTARLTTLYCAPSWSELITTMITNMQNHLLHHLISTKQCCALPKSTSVQNCIVNLDLHVCCQPDVTRLVDADVQH